MESKTPLTDAVTYICDEGSVLRVCEGLTEVVPADHARRLERALAWAEEALTKGTSDLRFAALAQIEELRK